MSHLRQYLIVAGLCAAWPTIGAQGQSRGAVDQIGAPQPVGMQQVAARPPAAAQSPAPRQLSLPGESTSRAQQLTSERRAGPASPQLTRGPRSAQSPEPLSQPRDGRTSAVERVAGSDRCDPRAKDARSAKCAAAIETRAAEFGRPDPTPLSPEQRIVMEQQQRERAGSVGGAVRRLAATGDDAESVEAQGVASLVLGAPPMPPRSDKPIDGPAVSDQMRAVINAMVNQSPPQ